MRYLKAHPLKENDSHLSDMTVVTKKADDTIVPQDRDENTDKFQHLSHASKIKSDTGSTYKMTGPGYNKLSNVADMEVNPSESTPKTDGKYQHLGHTPDVENPQIVNKLHSRPEQGDSYQHLSDAPEKDNVGSTYKKNDSNLDQNLSDVAESKIHKFNNFK